MFLKQVTQIFIKFFSTLKVSKYDDSDDESHYAEYLSSLIEIGPPKILRFQKKKANLGSRTSRSNNNASSLQVDEMPEFLSDFFQREIKDYLLGGIKCEFCQSTTFQWPTLINYSSNKVRPNYTLI